MNPKRPTISLFIKNRYFFEISFLFKVDTLNFETIFLFLTHTRVQVLSLTIRRINKTVTGLLSVPKRPSSSVKIKRKNFDRRSNNTQVFPTLTKKEMKVRKRGRFLANQCQNESSRENLQRWFNEHSNPEWCKSKNIVLGQRVKYKLENLAIPLVSFKKIKQKQLVFNFTKFR